MFVDAEKAFDNLNWDSMLMMLEKMYVGGNFLNTFKGIYKDQKSYLFINDDNAKDFQIWKSTWQGCSLSPLLFILVLEILLRNVQEKKEITGLKMGKYSYKYRALAADMLFIAENPITLFLKY